MHGLKPHPRHLIVEHETHIPCVKRWLKSHLNACKAEWPHWAAYHDLHTRVVAAAQLPWKKQIMN
eukprot:6808051-Karenia_brevis.AAC.1